MVVKDFLENMGVGLAIVIVVFVGFILISFLSAIIPGILSHILGLLFLLVVILIIGVLIYFVGKFAKDFIMNMR